MSQSIEEILEDILSNKTTKRYLLSQSFFMFIRLFLSHYFSLGIPLFQEDMIRNLENKRISELLITSFIGGGKTTIISIAYLLWEAFRTNEKKVIVHISRTKDEAYELSLRLQREIFWNDGLSETYGEPNKKLMTRRKIELPKVNTVLYFTHLYDEQFNYDIANIVIIDSPFSENNRTETIEKELALLGKIANKRTYDRTVIASSVYNREGAMAYLLKIKTTHKKLSYPFVDDSGKILWETKYTDDDIARLRSAVGDSVWCRSYLLDLRTVRHLQYWMADRGHNFSEFKSIEEKKAYHEEWYKNTLHFEKKITLGKFKFTSPKFGRTHIFIKEGEKSPDDYHWYY